MGVKLIPADKVKELIRGTLSVDTDEDKEYVCSLIDEIDSGWTSVKDHPPEKDEDVIIYGKYIGSSGMTYPEMLITNIREFVLNGFVPIAWMPRPEPPKEEE